MLPRCLPHRDPRDYRVVKLTEVATTVPAASATTAVSSSEGTTRVGFAVGAGVEKAIDAHWRVKAEYLYVDLGSHTFSPGTVNTNIKMHDNIVRVGFNYRFAPY